MHRTLLQHGIGSIDTKHLKINIISLSLQLHIFLWRRLFCQIELILAVLKGSRMICFWIRRSKVRSPAATSFAAVIAVAQTVTYKLKKFIFTVCHPVVWMRRYTEVPSQSPKLCRFIKLKTFLSVLTFYLLDDNDSLRSFQKDDES